jgi:uncharacterized protein YifE (UPF0438 family)
MLPREHYLKQPFQDSVNFPEGFAKSPELSDIQARLIRKHGTLIMALCADELSDPNADDLHLLRVIAHQSAPKTPVEQAWVKYLSLIDKSSPTKPANRQTRGNKALRASA